LPSLSQLIRAEAVEGGLAGCTKIARHHSEEEPTGSCNWDSSSLHSGSHEDPHRQKKALGMKLVSLFHKLKVQ